MFCCFWDKGIQLILSKTKLFPAKSTLYWILFFVLNKVINLICPLKYCSIHYLLNPLKYCLLVVLYSGVYNTFVWCGWNKSHTNTEAVIKCLRYIYMCKSDSKQSHIKHMMVQMWIVGPFQLPFRRSKWCHGRHE